MPKKISQQYIATIDQLDDEKYGVRLAKASIAAEIPMSYLAKVFGVSRMTMHSWFRGSPIRENNIIKIKKFLAILNQQWESKDNNYLPVKNNKQAKKLIDQKIIPQMNF